MKRNCFCCEKDIDHAGPEGDDQFNNPPNDATYWRTYGNYGSTVFDGGEFTGEQLEMYICDECLKKKSQHVYHFKVVNRNVENVKLFSEREN